MASFPVPEPLLSSSPGLATCGCVCRLLSAVKYERTSSSQHNDLFENSYTRQSRTGPPYLRLSTVLRTHEAMLRLPPAPLPPLPLLLLKRVTAALLLPCCTSRPCWEDLGASPRSSLERSS